MDAESLLSRFPEDLLQRAHARGTVPRDVLKIPLDDLSHLRFLQRDQDCHATGSGHERPAGSNLYRMRLEGGRAATGGADEVRAAAQHQVRNGMRTASKSRQWARTGLQELAVLPWQRETELEEHRARDVVPVAGTLLDKPFPHEAGEQTMRCAASERAMRCEIRQAPPELAAR